MADEVENAYGIAEGDGPAPYLSESEATQMTMSDSETEFTTITDPDNTGPEPSEKAPSNYGSWIILGIIIIMVAIIIIKNLFFKQKRLRETPLTDNFVWLRRLNISIMIAGPIIGLLGGMIRTYGGITLLDLLLMAFLFLAGFTSMRYFHPKRLSGKYGAITINIFSLVLSILSGFLNYMFIQENISVGSRNGAVVITVLPLAIMAVIIITNLRFLLYTKGDSTLKLLD